MAFCCAFLLLFLTCQSPSFKCHKSNYLGCESWRWLHLGKQQKDSFSKAGRKIRCFWWLWGQFSPTFFMQLHSLRIHVSAVSLSFHLNWDNKYSKSFLYGRNSASWEYQLLCLSLFQLAQLWAVEQTVWMTRGGILNPDITQSACGGKSECSACHSAARNRTNCLEGTETVQGAHCAGPCLPGDKHGLSLKLPARGVSVCTCLVLVFWVLRWLGHLTLAHSVSEVPCQTRSSFPWFSNKQQEQDCIQPAKLPVMAPPSPCSSKLSGGPEKGMEVQVLWVSCAASCPSSLKPAGSLFFSFPAAHPTFSPGPQAQQCFCALTLPHPLFWMLSSS